MPPALLIILLTIVFATLFLQVLIWRRVADSTSCSLALSQIQSHIELLRGLAEVSERAIRDEFSRTRQEQNASGHTLTVGLAGLSDSITAALQHQFGDSDARLDRFRQMIDQRVSALGGGMDLKVELLRAGVEESGSRLQSQVAQALDRLQSSLVQSAQQSREEIGTALRLLGGSVTDSITALVGAQESKLDEIRRSVESRLSAMNTDNERRLEQMRQTVEEKLQGTLESRLDASFSQVSQTLQDVHKDIVEMRNLAAGVSDLKRVFTNVKVRGTWGEVQLATLLEHMLTPDQYSKNVNTTGTQERVEFAIKLPGQDPGVTCWLPVDAKFPVEDYQRLVDASERCDTEAVETAGRKLEATLRQCAKTLSEKYLQPPMTTDFRHPVSRD